MKRLFLLLVLLMAALCTAACDERDGNSGTQQPQKILRVGTEPSFAPFEMQGKDGTLEGFDMDLIRAVGKEAGYEVRINSIGFDALIPALSAGNIDIAASGMTITDERRRKVRFSAPYYKSGLVMMLRSGNSEIRSFSDLKGKRIAVQIGTSGENKAKSIEGAIVRSFNTTAECALELRNGGCDAVVNDLPVVSYFVKTEGASFADIAGEVQEAEFYGLAMNLDNETLARDIDAALARCMENGTYDAIYEKWFGMRPGRKQAAAGTKRLRLGTEPSFAPFEMQKADGTFTGFDIELVQALGRRAGYDVEVVSLGFDALIPALTAGNIDVAAAGMTITDERRKKVDFTDSYYTSGLITMVRRDNTDIHGFDDLRGKRIAVQIGTSGEARAKLIEGASVKSYNGNSDCALELRNGGCDAIINDSPVLAYFAATDGADYAKVVGEVQEAEEYGIAIAKTNPALLKAFNKALADMRSSGEYDALYEHWFGKRNASGAASAEAAAQGVPAGNAGPAAGLPEKQQGGIIQFIIGILPLLIAGAGVTLEISVISVGTGLLIGCFVGIARVCDSRIVRCIAAVYVDFIRGTPLLVQIFLVYFAVPQLTGYRMDPFLSGIIACSVNSGAYVAEIFRAGIQSIDKGQMEAGRSLGLTWMKTMRFIIMPQAFKRMIPALGNEFITMLKDSSLVSVIGFEELTRSGQLIIARTYASFEVWISVAIIYLIMTIAVSRLVAALEKRFSAK